MKTTSKNIKIFFSRKTTSQKNSNFSHENNFKNNKNCFHEKQLQKTTTIFLMKNNFKKQQQFFSWKQLQKKNRKFFHEKQLQKTTNFRETLNPKTDIIFMISNPDLVRVHIFESRQCYRKCDLREHVLVRVTLIQGDDLESGSDHETDLIFTISTLDLLRVWIFSSLEWLWENDPDSGSSPWIRVRSWNWPQIRNHGPRFSQSACFCVKKVLERKRFERVHI